MKILYYKQEKLYTCGAAAMRIVLNSLGFDFKEEEIEKMLGTNDERGTWTKDFAELANKLNLQFISRSNSSIKELKSLIEDYLIIISFYTEDNYDHYTVIRRIDGQFIYFSDPWYGSDFKMNLAEFEERWKCDPRFEKIERWFLAVKKICFHI